MATKWKREKRPSIFKEIPEGDFTEEWLDIQGQAPSPSRDYHQLIVTSNNQVIWRTWKINNANKHGLGPTPVDIVFTHAQFKDEERLQDDIGRVFGADTVPYVQEIINGKFDYLQRLPMNIMINVAQYLHLEDLLNLSMANKHMALLWESSELWEYYFKKCSTEPMTRLIAELAAQVGWKETFMSNGFMPKLRAMESRTAQEKQISKSKRHQVT